MTTKTFVALGVASALAVSLTGGPASAQIFIPKKPEDLIPKKPEHVIPPPFRLPRAPESAPTYIPDQRDLATRFSYTLRNESDVAVRYRLPGGNEYRLSPGDRRSHVYDGPAGSAKITVLTSGRTYTLSSGSHKFWSMRDGRVGLDFAGR
jgi:hypothetical protein